MGRIKAEVFCAMRARYAIALYEALALRRNMDRCIETFPIDRFRELLAVKVDTYKIGTDFQRFVIDPVVLEVNGLSNMAVKIEVHRNTVAHRSTVSPWLGGRSLNRIRPPLFKSENAARSAAWRDSKGAVETATPHIALSLPRQA